MKKNYTTLVVAILFTIASFSQGYELGIVHETGDSFKIVAIPDFDSNGNVDASDVGFTLMLPAGANDVTNHVGLFTGRTWSTQQHDAAFLTSLGLGDGTKDAWQFNLPPGQSIYSHSTGDQIDLVSFDISGSPTTGEMYILLNSDPIALGAGNVLDSFFNSNIDSSTTQDYFSGLVTGMESFDFSTLKISKEIFTAQVNIYPNPTTNFTTITLSEKGNYKITLFDSLGKKILNWYVNNDNTSQINMCNLEIGMYLLHMRNNQNQIKTFKILKK